MGLNKTSKQLSLGYSKKGAALLDIETTGLSPDQDQIICIGLLSLEEGSLTQWILDYASDEPVLIQEVLGVLSGYTTLYLCGQNQFDLAFFLSRVEAMNLLGVSHNHLTSVSLLRVPFFKLLRDSGFSTRNDLETLLGYSRSSHTSGRELAKLAKLYLLSPSPLHQQVILQHNRDELLGCLYFYELYTQMNRLPQLDAITAHTEDHILFDYPLQVHRLSDFCISLDPISIQVITGENKLRLTVIPKKLQLRRYLYPAKDYVFIPSEGQLLHKSIAQFFPSTMKEKVPQTRCFLTQEIDFIPLWSKAKEKSPQWVDDKKNLYIPFKEVEDLVLIEQKLLKYLTQG